MPELVTFTLPGAQSFVAEVDTPAGYDVGYDAPGGPNGGYREGSDPVGRWADSSRLGRVFESRLGQVRDAAAAALEVLRDAGNPDEIKLSLGVKLTQEAGAVLARTALEGNIAVELLWKRPAPRTDEQS
jgi:hypothetical protein